MQTLAIDLLPGEIVYSQTNCMCWMNDAIEMNTNTGGGFLAGVGRMFGGGRPTECFRQLRQTWFLGQAFDHLASCDRPRGVDAG